MKTAMDRMMAALASKGYEQVYRHNSGARLFRGADGSWAIMEPADRQVLVMSAALSPDGCEGPLLRESRSMPGGIAGEEEINRKNRELERDLRVAGARRMPE